MPAAVFFRTPNNFFSFEQTALKLCCGTVSTWGGGGADVYTLYRQEQGFDVRALKVVPEAIEIMKKRGVRELIETNIF